MNYWYLPRTTSAAVANYETNVFNNVIEIREPSIEWSLHVIEICLCILTTPHRKSPISVVAEDTWPRIYKNLNMAEGNFKKFNDKLKQEDDHLLNIFFEVTLQ